MPSSTWEPLRENRGAALALLEQSETEARAAGRTLESEGLAIRRKEISDGSSEGAVLCDRSDRAVALAIWERIGSLGRRVAFLTVERDERTPEGWRRVLASILQTPDPAGPILLLNCELAGLPENDAGTFLRPLGFFAYHRFGLTFPPGTPLPALTTPDSSAVRLKNLGPADTEDLATLSSASYDQTIDRFLFASVEDAREDARRLLRSVFEGKYGTFLPGASFGLLLDGQLRGATLVTDRTRYRLIADVEVHPTVQRKGFARRLLRATLEATASDTSNPVVLAVTRENGVAYDLYRRIGFEVAEGPFTFWARCKELGVPAPPSVP